MRVSCVLLACLQSAIDAEKARATTVLPPLQSVLELTTAFRPPERTGAVTAAPAPAAASDTATATSTATDAEAVAPVGRALPDGSGRLADGTWWEKKSGVEYGKVCGLRTSVRACMPGDRRRMQGCREWCG